MLQCFVILVRAFWISKGFPALKCFLHKLNYEHHGQCSLRACVDALYSASFIALSVFYMHGEVLQDMIYPLSFLYLFCSWKLLVFFHQTCLPSCISWLEAGEEASTCVQDFSGAACCFCLPWVVRKWDVIQVLEIIAGISDTTADTLPMTDRLEYCWFHRCVWKDSK